MKLIALDRLGNQLLSAQVLVVPEKLVGRRFRRDTKPLKSYSNLQPHDQG